MMFKNTGEVILVLTDTYLYTNYYCVGRYGKKAFVSGTNLAGVNR